MDNQALAPLGCVRCVHRYLVDANGLVWQQGATEPLKLMPLEQLVNTITHGGRSIIGKAPHLLIPGVWQMRTLHAAKVPGWHGNLIDFFLEQASGYANAKSWSLILPHNQGTPRAHHQFMEAHRSVHPGSRRDSRYIVMGKMAFASIRKDGNCI